MADQRIYREPIVITGIGALASVGGDRESVWQAVQDGKSGVQILRGINGIPDGEMIGATIDVDVPDQRLKQLLLVNRAAEEALADARIDLDKIDRERFGCSASAVMGDWTSKIDADGLYRVPLDRTPWFGQWLPNTPVADIAQRFGLNGPRTGYSTACASGLICVLSAVRSIRDGQCDIALAGGGDAIDGLMLWPNTISRNRPAARLIATVPVSFWAKGRPCSWSNGWGMRWPAERRSMLKSAAGRCFRKRTMSLRWKRIPRP